MFPKSVLKLLLWIYVYIIPGNKATGKGIFQLLVSEVVDSQQWRISPSKFWQGVQDFNFKVAYYCSNHLKLMLCIGEASL